MLEPAKQKMRQVGGQAIDDAASRMGATGGDEHEESPLQQPTTLAPVGSTPSTEPLH